MDVAVKMKAASGRWVDLLFCLAKNRRMYTTPVLVRCGHYRVQKFTGGATLEQEGIGSGQEYG
jgi:hypothetical protein